MSDAGDQAVTFVYLIGCLVLVASAFLVRRIPIGQGLKMFAAWVLIFGFVFVGFTLRDDFRALGGRVMKEVRGESGTVEAGGELRIRQSDDGHFWVSAKLNGVDTRFLVDSGATITSISKSAAQRAGIAPGRFPGVVETANGRIKVERGRAERLEVGPIERRNLAVHMAEEFGDTNVLGMNFLSSLSRWEVEGRWLVLHP